MVGLLESPAEFGHSRRRVCEPLYKTILTATVGVGLSACAAQIGDVSAGISSLPSNMAFSSNMAQPWQPPEPARPKAFPPVQLVWAQAVGGGAPVAPPPRPVLVAHGLVGYGGPDVGRPTKPRPDPEPDPPQDLEPADGPPTVPEPEPPDTGPTPHRDPEEPEPPDTRPTPHRDPEEPLLPEDFLLPDRLDDAAVEENHFHDQANQTLARVYASDGDDPSVLLSLYEKLMTHVNLERLRQGWQEPIERAISRAETLQRVTAAIRGLRTAFADAKPGSEPTVYTGIDHAQCRSAFAHLYKTDPEAIDLAVTIENLGRRNLGDVETICRDSNDAELATRKFPEQEGPKKLRMLVKRTYKKAYRRRAVRKVSIPQAGWEVLENRRILRAIVGVRRNNAFPEAPCVMQAIIIEQQKKRRRYGRPVCCQIESSVAIACSELERSERISP